MEKLILGKKLNEKKTRELCCISILCILNWDKKEQSMTRLCKYSLKENKEKYLKKKNDKVCLCKYKQIPKNFER